MKLNEMGLKNQDVWKAAGYQLPQFDREAMKKNTKENPTWIHFGAGNIFRAFQANVVQNLLNAGVMKEGLIVAEGYDYEIIEKMNHPHDDYSILATLKADGTVEKTVVGSVAQSYALDFNKEEETTSLKEIFSKKSLQMASFTITEKGYVLTNGAGEILPEVATDMKQKPEMAQSYIGKVTALLFTRYCEGKYPIAMVSMDNCSHNGTKLQEAICMFAKHWVENGQVEEGFLAYVRNPQKVSFPWSMIDKITPRPNPSVEDMLKADKVEGLEPVITEKNTYVAPFVNAEECEYLVIDDAFPNGRPPLEKGGVIFTTRETVDKVEKMKVCTCLNPLHTALAVFGCLLSYELISKEMEDETLRRLVEGIGYKEGLPVVVNPGILDPKEFIDTVLTVRIPNPFMPDTPQRIATDTSQKLGVRFGETIKAYQKSDVLKVSELKLIPLVFAGWIRYLIAVDDNGKEFELSPDPLLNTVCPQLKSISLGFEGQVEELLSPILSNETIFGVNLQEVGLATLTCQYFKEMIQGPGAVKSTLKKYV